jgi:hypothetical protein
MRWITLPEGADPETQLHFAAVLAVHASLMPTGEILYFGGDEHDRELWRKGRTDPSGVDHTRLFNCATLEVEEFNPHSPTSDVFCCGHAMLTDGRLLVVGGTEVFAEEDPGIHHQHMPGLKDSWIYDPFSRTWIRVSPLNEFPQFINRKNPGDTGGRWYPTVVTLSDGSVLAIAGHPSQHDSRHNSHIPERFVPGSASPGVWIRLAEPGADFETNDDTRLYPRAHLLPNGMVFCSTPLGNVAQSHLIDPMTGTRRPAGDAPPRDHVDSILPNGVYWGNFFTQCATSVLLPLLPGRSYAPKVLICGGDQQFVIDLQDLMRNPDARPQWAPTSPRSMSGPRFHLNAVLLPTGDVFVCGGCSKFNDDNFGALIPEMYHPESNSWEALTSQPARIVRNYHSVALLMPDGRIWTAGSDHNGQQGESSADLRIEVFEPDYFGRPDRPVIGSAPALVNLAQTFDVDTPQAGTVTRVAVIRSGSVTHAFGNDQRYVGLEFQPTSGSRLRIVAPPNGNVAPPGYYLLFLINGEGVPSEGRFIRITNAFSLRQFLLSRGFDPGQGIRHIQPPITSVRAFMNV